MVAKRHIPAPLPLSDVPEDVALLYEECSEYIAAAKLTLRYTNANVPRPWPAETTEKAISTIVAMVAQNQSVVSSPNNPNPAVDDDPQNKRVSLDKAFYEMTPHERIEKLVRSVVTARKGFAKSAGLMLNNVTGHGYAWVPVWGAGVVGVDVSYKDRELRYVYVNRDMPEDIEAELQEVLLVHTIIEMTYWAPEGLGRPFPKDWIVSVPASRVLPLMPISVLKFLRRTEILAQHFVSKGKEDYKHMRIQCPCRTWKNYETTYVARDGHIVQQYLVGQYNAKPLRVAQICATGPSSELQRYLNLLFRRAISP